MHLALFLAVLLLAAVLAIAGFIHWIPAVGLVLFAGALLAAAYRGGK